MKKSTAPTTIRPTSPNALLTFDAGINDPPHSSVPGTSMKAICPGTDSGRHHKIQPEHAKKDGDEVSGGH